MMRLPMRGVKASISCSQVVANGRRGRIRGIFVFGDAFFPGITGESDAKGMRLVGGLDGENIDPRIAALSAVARE